MFVLGLPCCPPLNQGMVQPLMGPKPASYYASPGVMSLLPYVVARDQSGSLSLQAATAEDVNFLGSSRQVTGRACQYGLQIPFGLFDAHRDGRRALAISAGWGDGGTTAALEDASRGMAAGDALYDIRVDLNTVTILGVCREECVVVNARVSPAALKGIAQNTFAIEHI